MTDLSQRMLASAGHPVAAAVLRTGEINTLHRGDVIISRLCVKTK